MFKSIRRVIFYGVIAYLVVPALFFMASTTLLPVAASKPATPTTRRYAGRTRTSGPPVRKRPADRIRT
jgi:hypothetical protein